MRNIILATAAALALSTGAALADSGEGGLGAFTGQPFAVWAGLANPPATGTTAIAQSGSAIHAYVTQSGSAVAYSEPNQGANS